MSPSSIFMSIFIFIFIILRIAYADTLFRREKQGLLTFINSVVPHTELSNSWNESQPPCSWRGVGCDPTNTTVLYLRLPAAGLTGVIPPHSIGELASLRMLSLQHNRLSGPIPTDFARLKYLITLLLNNNNLSGQLPYIIGDYLTNFNVSYNKLNGSIPYSVSKYPKSAFSGNAFLCDGPLPPCRSGLYPPAVYAEERERERKRAMPKMRRETTGFSAGSGLLLLILLSWVGKKIYQRMNKPCDGRSGFVVFDRDHNDVKLEDLLMNTPREALGPGSTAGMSWKKELVGRNTTVVVKMLKDVVLTETKYKRAVKALRKVTNKEALVPLRACYNLLKDGTLVVYDYMHAGSLSAHLHGSTSSDQTQLDLDRRMRIALSVAKGLKYLHSNKHFIHGNIKSSNIFFQKETSNEVLLSEYGLYPFFHKLVYLKVTAYWAPEVLESQKFTLKSDVYSFGVLLLELLTGKNPNESNKKGDDISNWASSIEYKKPKVEHNNNQLDQDQNIDKMAELFEIAKECVSIMPNQRPQMHVVVSKIDNILQK